MLALVLLSGCQSVQQKRVDLLKDRVQKLRPLSTYKPTVCQIDVQLTEPAKARYREMFPRDEKELDRLSFAWRARESSCEVTATEKSPLAENYKGFLQSALCVLLQSHWVNSPFDEFPYTPEHLVGIEGRPDAVLLKASDKGEAGLILDPQVFTVETRTKSRGVFSATYTEKDGEWLPARLQQTSWGGTQIVVDDFEWSPQRIGGRRMIQSVFISAGEEQAHRHSQLVMRECREW